MTRRAILAFVATARAEGRHPALILEDMKRRFGSVYNDRELHVFLFDQAAPEARRRHRWSIGVLTFLLLAAAVARLVIALQRDRAPVLLHLIYPAMDFVLAAEVANGRRGFVLGAAGWHAFIAATTALFLMGEGPSPIALAILGLHAVIALMSGYLLRTIWPMLTLRGKYRGEPLVVPPADRD
jgi:hypothetical protein